jgi:integrase/recombinase XerC
MKHTMPDNSAKAIKSHLDHLRRQNLSPDTIRQRGSALRRLDATVEGDILDLTRLDLVAWQSGLTVSASSVGTYTSHVKAFYAWAVDMELIDVDPAGRLSRPKIPDPLPRPIPSDDLQLVFACAMGQVRIWVLLGVFMGLRAKEVADIHREHITEVVIDGKTRLLISGIGKGSRPFRLPVPAAIAPTLRTYMTSRRGPLWIMPSGRPADRSDVTHDVSEFFQSLNQLHTFHCCRHTFGTLLYRELRDILAVAERMRHRDTRTTQGYVEPVDGEATDAMDRIAAAQLKHPDQEAS